MLLNIQNDLKSAYNMKLSYGTTTYQSRRFGAFCKDGIYSVQKKLDKYNSSHRPRPYFTKNKLSHYPNPQLFVKNNC